MKEPDDPRLLRALLSHRLLVLSNTLALAASRHYSRRFGVRLAEWRVIDALHAGGGVTANQISRWLLTDKGWVSRSVERLIRAGYVRRSPDPAHGRRVLLRLTAKGERSYQAIAAAAQQRHRNLLQPFSPAERASLERMLGRLHEHAKALLASPGLGFEALPRRRRGRLRR